MAISLKDKKVLIAEDEAPMLNALAEKFTKEGCSIIRAEDGEKALAAAISEKPDAILLDIIMPQKSGLDVLQAIREDSDWGKHVPIVILTNVTPNDKVMNTISKYEPAYYLVKIDWKLDDVVQKVKDCFKG